MAELARRLLEANKDRPGHVTTGNGRRGEENWVYGGAAARAGPAAPPFRGTAGLGHILVPVVPVVPAAGRCSPVTVTAPGPGSVRAGTGLRPPRLASRGRPG
jgi:hypothetical protein